MTATTRLTQYLVTATLLVSGMLVGLAAQAVIAYYFGVGRDSDALFLARDVADLAFKALVPAQAAGVLVPLYVAARTRSGDHEAARTASGVLGLGVLVALPIVLLTIALAGPLVAVLAPGFDDPTARLATELLRIVAATTLFMLVATLAVALLQAREYFGRAMMIQIAGNVAQVIALPILITAIGIQGAAAAMLIGSAATMLVSLALLAKAGIPPFVLPQRVWSDIRTFTRRWATFLPVAGGAQLSGIVFRISASTLGSGGYAVVALAQRLNRAVLALLLTPVQYVLLPALARSEAEGRRDAADADLVGTMRQVVFFVTPMVAGLIVLRSEAVSLVFQRGEFTQAAVGDTAPVMAVFVAAIIPNAIYLLLEQAALARHRADQVVRGNLLAELVQMVSYYPLSLLLGASGLAVGSGLSLVAIVVYYGLVLRPRGLHPRKHLDFALRLLIAVAGLVLATAAVRELVSSSASPGGGLAQAIVIVPSAIAGGCVYLALALLLRLREPRVLAAAVMQLRKGSLV